ncbi:MAG: nucleotide sugar dehydrogenase [Fimbriimonadaceae bacterium]|nr:MAG: nucleotide sugar dehydrogenase [Fimbriimonadaceae bacterium]
MIINELLTKIENKTAKIGVLGLGYVGLPMALEAAEVGFPVTGIDLNAQKVDGLNRGISHVKDIQDSEVLRPVESGKFKSTTDLDVLRELDVIIIAVPTPLDVHLVPDMAFVESASKMVGDRIQRGQLVCLKSTTYPGTTQDVLVPALEKSGLKVEEDIFVCYAPERVDPGNAKYTTKNTPKIVGGEGPNSLTAASSLFGAIIDEIVPVSSCAAAELAKVFENTFRAVNVGLVNELLIFCDKTGLDVWEVLDAANTKPFGIMKFMPGPGVGGHCIPLDPHYLEWKAREYKFRTRFIEVAGEVNRLMPGFCVQKAGRILNDFCKPLKNAKVVVLGVAYKGDIDDWRESPALDIILELESYNADVVYHDPYLPEFHEHGKHFKGVEMTDDLIRSSDLVIIATAHKITDYQKVIDLAPAILDTRGITRNYQDPDKKVTLL